MHAMMAPIMKYAASETSNAYAYLLFFVRTARSRLVKLRRRPLAPLRSPRAFGGRVYSQCDKEIRKTSLFDQNQGHWGPFGAPEPDMNSAATCSYRAQSSTRVHLLSILVVLGIACAVHGALMTEVVVSGQRMALMQMRGESSKSAVMRFIEGLWTEYGMNQLEYFTLMSTLREQADWLSKAHWYAPVLSVTVPGQTAAFELWYGDEPAAAVGAYVERHGLQDGEAIEELLLAAREAAVAYEGDAVAGWVEVPTGPGGALERLAVFEGQSWDAAVGSFLEKRGAEHLSRETVATLHAAVGEDRPWRTDAGGTVVRFVWEKDVFLSRKQLEGYLPVARVGDRDAVGPVWCKATPPENPRCPSSAFGSPDAPSDCYSVLFTTSQYSGTEFLALAFTLAGMDVRHEAASASDGVSDSLVAVHAPYQPAYRVLVQARHPLSVLRSHQGSWSSLVSIMGQHQPPFLLTWTTRLAQYNAAWADNTVALPFKMLALWVSSMANALEAGYCWWRLEDLSRDPGMLRDVCLLAGLDSPAGRADLHGRCEQDWAEVARGARAATHKHASNEQAMTWAQLEYVATSNLEKHIIREARWLCGILGYSGC